jgi:hypothetical protein
VGTTSRVEFSLAVAGLAETVEVSAQSLAVDLRSRPRLPPTSRVSGSSYIPRGRDFTDVVSQAAGAANESQAGGISIDGASGAENRFVIDGIDTTSPQVGTSAVPLRAEFLEEVQVKSAGYSAEFGGSTGGVINAITKSGANEWHGGILTDFQKRSWGGTSGRSWCDSLTANTYEYIQPNKDEETRIDPGFFFSGPILKGPDLVLRVLSARHPQHRSAPSRSRTARVQHVPAGLPRQLRHVQRDRQRRLEAALQGRGNFSPYETENPCPGRRPYVAHLPDDYLRGTKGRARALLGIGGLHPDRKLVISGRVGRFVTDRESTEVQFPGLIHNVLDGEHAGRPGAAA